MKSVSYMRLSRKDVSRAYGPEFEPLILDFRLACHSRKGISYFSLEGLDSEDWEWKPLLRNPSKSRLASLCGVSRATI